jgi:hypothetical protein
MFHNNFTEHFARKISGKENKETSYRLLMDNDRKQVVMSPGYSEERRLQFAHYSPFSFFVKCAYDVCLLF